MPTFSILTGRDVNGDRVSGGWVQDHVGTLESAAEVARETSKVNSGNPYAVVPVIRCPVAILGHWADQKILYHTHIEQSNDSILQPE